MGEAIPFEDKKAIEDVACYVVRNPLSLKKLVVRPARVNRARLIGRDRFAIPGLDGQKAVRYRSFRDRGRAFNVLSVGATEGAMSRARKRASGKAARRPSAVRKQGPHAARERTATVGLPSGWSACPARLRSRRGDGEGIRGRAGRVADPIGAEALEAERARLAAELASEQILRDLLKLARAFTAASRGTLPADLEVLHKLPEAVLEWARQRFGVAPHLAVGQELDVPPDRRAGFALDGSLPPAGSGLVRVRVISPGWKRGARLLVPPRAIII